MNSFKKKYLVAATCGLFVLTSVCSVAIAAKPSAIATSVAIGGDSNWQKQMFERIERRVFRVIHASEDQKEKLTAIFNSTFKQNADLRKELKAKTLDLAKAYADDSVSNDQIKERVTAINDLRAKLRNKRVEALLSAREVLSVKQRQILSERLNERLGDD